MKYFFTLHTITIKTPCKKGRTDSFCSFYHISLRKNQNFFRPLELQDQSPKGYFSDSIFSHCSGLPVISVLRKKLFLVLRLFRVFCCLIQHLFHFVINPLSSSLSDLSVYCSFCFFRSVFFLLFSG